MYSWSQKNFHPFHTWGRRMTIWWWHCGILYGNKYFSHRLCFGDYCQDYSWHHCQIWRGSQIAKFMGPTWGPPGSCRPPDGPHVGPMNLAIRGVLRAGQPGISNARPGPAWLNALSSKKAVNIILIQSSNASASKNIFSVLMKFCEGLSFNDFKSVFFKYAFVFNPGTDYIQNCCTCIT